MIALLCEIDENITSYVSRHSFATILKQHDVPVTAISEMLGHKDLKTTQIYLDSLSSKTLDKYSEIISNI